MCCCCIIMREKKLEGRSSALFEVRVLTNRVIFNFFNVELWGFLSCWVMDGVG